MIIIITRLPGCYTLQETTHLTLVRQSGQSYINFLHPWFFIVVVVVIVIEVFDFYT